MTGSSICTCRHFWCVTLQADKLDHVGILHHNPEGEVIFFHRTSGGKVNPMAPPGEQILQPHYTTVPLTAKAAWEFFNDAAESANYRYAKDRIQKGALAKCASVKDRQLLYRPICAGVAVQAQDTLPVSVLTQQDLQGTQLGTVYNISTAKFLELQEKMQIPGQQFLKELGWWR